MGLVCSKAHEGLLRTAAWIGDAMQRPCESDVAC
jgi:hypothetical protein